MQVRELIALGHFLKTFIQEHNLPNQYQQLIDAVNQAAQNQNPENVGLRFNDIIKIHKEAEQKILSAAQSKLLADYGGDQLLGRPAITRLEEIFRENQAHPQGLTSALQQITKETNQLAKKANQLISVLEPMLVELKIDTDDIDKNEGRLWLYFSEATSINTIEELEKAAETWKQILHHFSRMPNASADFGRILQINKLSPVELEVAANIALLMPLAFGIKWVLSRIEHVIKICQEAEKLKQMKIKTQIVDALFKEAKDQRKLIARDGAGAIKTEFNTNDEARNAAEKALNKIIDFIEGGGQLDIDLGDTATEDSDTPESRETSHIQLLEFIKSIRKDIKLLPSLSEGDEKDKEVSE